MSSKKTKKKRKELSGAVATSDEQVIIESWDIQERKLKTSHLGLTQFLNKHCSIRKTEDMNDSYGKEASL